MVFSMVFCNGLVLKGPKTRFAVENLVFKGRKPVSGLIHARILRSRCGFQVILGSRSSGLYLPDSVCKLLMGDTTTSP